MTCAESSLWESMGFPWNVMLVSLPFLSVVMLTFLYLSLRRGEEPQQ
jgi:membrane protein implicated in regulation of membrane protease activity